MRILLTVSALVLILFSCSTPSRAYDGCYAIPVTTNTPTAIAGCEVWGEGKGSHYGPGDGVAMNFCTWERRNNEGCGLVTITSLDTNRSVTVPVIDFCDCYTGTVDQRVVDMQHGVVAALGLNLARGLYPVVVEPVGPTEHAQPAMLPDTATEYCGGFNGVVIILAAFLGAIASALTVLLLSGRIFRR